jgi:hypothetical protein
MIGAKKDFLWKKTFVLKFIWFFFFFFFSIPYNFIMFLDYCKCCIVAYMDF